MVGVVVDPIFLNFSFQNSFEHIAALLEHFHPGEGRKTRPARPDGEYAPKP